MAAEPSAPRPPTPRRLRDRLHLANQLGHTHPSQHRGEIPYVDPCLRDVAGAPCLPAYRFSQSAIPRRHRADRRKIRRHTSRAPDGCRLHPPRFGAFFDRCWGVARCETLADRTPESGVTGKVLTAQDFIRVPNERRRDVSADTTGHIGTYARVGADRLARSHGRNAPSEPAAPDSRGSGKVHRSSGGSGAPGRSIEIGTSAGYSTLWLALACRASGKRITTYEILPEKAGLARQTFDSAGVWDVVELVHGNALDCLPALDDIGFCFLDAEKEIYAPCYELLVPRMRSGGILVADNAINHVAALRPMLERGLQDDRLDALIVPIGNGELICRKR